MQSNSSDWSECYDNIKVLNLFDPYLQMINTKFIIKSKLKDLVSHLRKFEAQ